MNQTRKLRDWIEIGLVILAIILIPLFFAIRSRAGETGNANTQPASGTGTPPGVIFVTPPGPTPTVVLPTAAPVVANGKEPPDCTFPLPQTTMKQLIAPQSYTFSEPQDIHIENSNITSSQIIEWLPDSQHALITRFHQDKSYQSIEVLNPQTGNTQVYATRTTVLGEPKWIQGLNAVVYPFTTLVNTDLHNPNSLRPPYHMQRQLWMSTGNPASAVSLENNVMTLGYGSVYSIAVKPDGSEFVYSSNTDKQPVRRDIMKNSLGVSQSVPFDLSQLPNIPTGSSAAPISYQMTWRPNTTQVFLYSNGGYGHFTFLLNVVSGQSCKINLNGNTSSSQLAVDLFPRWSSTGRYLAVLTAGGFEVLDTGTGNLYEIDEKQLLPSGTTGQISINDVAWAPDNEHLAAAVSASNTKLRTLYLIDLFSKQIVQMPSNIELGSHYDETNLLWSDDGSHILVKCAASDSLCLLSASINNRP